MTRAVLKTQDEWTFCNVNVTKFSEDSVDHIRYTVRLYSYVHDHNMHWMHVIISDQTLPEPLCLTAFFPLDHDEEKAGVIRRQPPVAHLVLHVPGRGLPVHLREGRREAEL